MSAIMMDGKALASRVKADLAQHVTSLKAQAITPGLGTILVGDDPGSRSYVAGKHRDCQEVGIASLRIDLPVSASEKDVLAAVSELNTSPECTGYIVQLPLPHGVNTQRIIEAIDPDKDADGLHPINLGRLVAGFPGPLPCTPRAIVELLHHYSIPTEGADVVILGRGLTVGRPLSLLLSSKSANSTVTVVHTKTKNLTEHTKRADIVIAAMGQPHMVTAEMIKPGAAVIDVGISRAGSDLIGDVHPGVKEIAAYVAPMPGGVGPMTRAMLLTNVVEACQR